MKTINNKIIKAMAIFMLLAVMVTVFASCSSSIEGTYKATTNDGEYAILILTENSYQISFYDAEGNYDESSSEYGNYTMGDGSITLSPFGGEPYICTLEKDGSDLLIDGGYWEKQ